MEEHEWNPDYPAQEMHIKFLNDTIIGKELVIQEQNEEIAQLKDTIKGLMEEISVAGEEMELHGHRL